MKQSRLMSVLFLLALRSVWGDGIVVDKVYHPYVLANEREFEWRLMSMKDTDFNGLAQSFGYGHSIAENVMLEGYIIAERGADNDFAVQSYELELRWMMTEQGQYWLDFGSMFELEKSRELDNYEATFGFIAEKEFTKTSLTLNLFAVREWGDTLESEWESEFRMKYRYRYMPEVQPAIELYAGEDYLGIGPAFMGIIRFDGQEQLKWEAGFITEVAHSNNNHTLRLALEYEF